MGTEKKQETDSTEITVVQPTSAWRPQDADREYIKADIRRRVWSSNASPKAQFIPAKPLPTVQDDGQKTVAVYARVSTKSTEQVSSIENQTRYYTEKVEKTPNWDMYQIYSDAPVIIGLKPNPTKTGAALVLFSLFTGIFETFR